jgi:hypothetical protein
VPNGSVDAELARRIGQATGEYKALQRVWKHASITRKKKLQIFEACVLSKLLYSLHTLVLTKVQTRRLNAFQAKCLRQICGIAPSFVSHVPNQGVLDSAGVKSLSTTLLQRQLYLFGSVARKSPGSIVRDVALEPGTVRPKVWWSRRRRGRPRTAWAPYVYNHARALAGSERQLSSLLQDEALWRHAVQHYTNKDRS